MKALLPQRVTTVDVLGGDGAIEVVVTVGLEVVGVATEVSKEGVLVKIEVMVGAGELLLTIILG